MPRIRRRSTTIAFCCLIAVSAAAVRAQAPANKPAPGTAVPPAKAYGDLLSLLEKEFVGAAEAMPEEKYDFAPATSMGEFKGVRTFGEQVKHVAGANWYFFGPPTMTQDEDKAKEDATDKLKTKAQIIAALKDSFKQAHAFVDGITNENAFVVMQRGNTRAAMASFGLAHCMDHYGQMVEYLRMNGIVPPASRGGGM